MLTKDEKKQLDVEHAYHREMEVFGYQQNIDNYALMLDVLPKDAWPDNLKQHAGTPVANLPADMTDEDVEAVSRYQYRDRLRVLLRTERAEQAKAALVRDVLKTRLGGEYDALVQARKAAEAAKA